MIRRLRRQPIRTSLAALALLAFPGSAAGEPPAPAAAQAPATTPGAEPQRDWELRALLYVWASAIDADVSARGVDTGVSASFGDLLQHLGWGFMGGAELRYRRALLVVDGIGNQLADETGAGRRTLPFQLAPGGPGGQLTVGPVDVKARSTMWIVGLEAGWRAVSMPVSEAVGEPRAEDRRRLDVDLLAGFRYWNVATKLRVGVDPASLTIRGVPVDLAGLGSRIPGVSIGSIGLPGRVLQGGSETDQGTDAWFDPILGVRLRGDITETVSLFTLADVGGFGIGEASKVTWQAALGLDWRFAEHWSLVLAYRGLGTSRSNPASDVILHGPVLGLGLRF